MILLLRKLQLIAIGYDESATYPGLAGGLFAAFKDAVELAVLAACGYALYRRLVQKPARLERNREALLILSLIVAIMVTDFAFDALPLRAALGRRSRDRARARLRVRRRRCSRSGLAAFRARLAAGYHGFYWLQLLLVFAFLVILPTGEHFHIVTALPALFFRRGRPANVVPYVDLERAMAGDDETTMRIGARSARDLTWKEGLDAFTCTECGRCKDACPTFLTGKPLSLKWVNDSLKHHLLEQRDALVAGVPDEALPPLVPGVIGEETLWACTTCGYCEAACPIELEHLPQVLPPAPAPRDDGRRVPARAARRLRRLRGAEQPVGPARRHARRLGGRRGRAGPARRRARASGLDYLFYVGSAESFDARGQKIAAAFARILRAAGVSIAVLGARETSTGECVRRAGNEMLFQQLAATLVATLNEFGMRRIVTCDPHAYNTLRNEYPALGGHYEVVHHTQLIARLARGGTDRAAPRARAGDLPRALLPRAATTASTRRRARSCGPLARRAARIRLVAREGDVLRRGRRAACGWRRRSASASTSRASSRRFRTRHASSPPRAPIAPS